MSEIAKLNKMIQDQAEKIFELIDNFLKKDRALTLMTLADIGQWAKVELKNIGRSHAALEMLEALKQLHAHEETENKGNMH